MAAVKKKPTPAGKETIYVDVDDEITHVIDKIKSSDKKIVALVLPKRATMLQSVVNMKLLKRASTNAKKSIVLITSETALLPLAGAAGIHVAKSLQSKPIIPPLPDQGHDTAEEAIDLGDDAATLDKSAAIGTLAAKSADIAHEDDDEVVEFDNVKVDDEPVLSALKNGKQKAGKRKHLKVPNFERFRLGFVLAGLGVVLLIVGWILAVVVLPKATIAIKTDTSSVVSSFDFTASTTQPELDINDKKIPAVMKESKKTDTAKVPATGERDDGTKASGTITLSVACTAGNSVSVPAGTAVSTGGLNFITQTTARLDDYSPTPCQFTKNVKVVAAQNGDQYNVESGKKFAIAGFSSVSGANEDAFEGGTSKIVKIVSQKDIDDALAQITERQGSSATDELKASLESEGLFPLTETLQAGEPVNKVTPELGKEAAEVTVSSDISYSMLGVKKEELAQLVERDIADEVDLEKQSVIDDGIDTSIMRINNNTTVGQAFISFRTSVVVGPEIDEEAIKEFARGKKRGEIEQYVESIPGVQEAEITYSPFWVYSTPKAAKKITVTIEKPQEAETTGTNNSSNE